MKRQLKKQFPNLTPDDIEQITTNYGGIYAVPWSFLIGVNGEIIKVYPGAILKSYDPAMFQDLVYNIESQLKINN